MADRATDVLMYIKLKGSTVPGEATSMVDNDDMTSDFTPGFFFELKSFSFGVKLQDTNKRKGSDKNSGGGNSKGGSSSNNDRGGSSSSQESHESSSDKLPFSAFYEGNPTAIPVELGEISFERTLDKGSSTLWNYFLSKEVIPSAAIVRRKNVGGSHPMGYLKFLFNDLLITDIDWSESDLLVIEKCKLICRSALITYKLEDFNNNLEEASGYGWGYLQPNGFSS